MRGNANQPQGQEQNDEINQDQIIENHTLEVDDAIHIERIHRRVNEWFALIDHNRERESQGLEPIYPWANHPELTAVEKASNEANSSHYSDVAGSLSHLSLEDGNLTQIHDNSLSWEEDALINDAPEGEFNLNNLAIFRTPSVSPNNVFSAYPLIPNFLLPPESSSLHNHDLSHIPISLASQTRVVPTELENTHIYVPTGEGSSIVLLHPICLIPWKKIETSRL